MSENYESMPLQTLRELAKTQGIKGISSLRKQELINALKMVELSETQSKRDTPTLNQKETINIEENESIQEKSKELVDLIKENDSIKKEESTKEATVARQEQTNHSIVRDRSSNRVDTQTQPQQRKQQPMMRRPATNSSSGSYQQRSDTNRVEYRKNDNVKVDSNRVDSFKSDNTKLDNTKSDSNEAITINDSIKPLGSRTENNRTENNRPDTVRTDLAAVPSEYDQLDSGETKRGILEVLSDGYGFIRCDNFLPGENDVYVSPAQIRRFNLKTGDIIIGNTRVRNQNEKFSALLYVKSINGLHPAEATKRKRFEDLTPIYPNERIHLETAGCGPAMRMVDIICPIGKGQRGMIVSQPKAGKTTLLKQVAKAITKNHSDMHLIVLLIDERPEEVTDMKESIEGGNVEVIYSTFDELPENHKRVSEMVIERAKRLVEHKMDVVILLDSITRLARAYNLTCQSSGRTLSGGLDPAALHMPKKFFGAARNMREGGSLTILATALVETGSRMDDVVFEEFKGTGNMELVLDRSLSEKRIFPAIDLPKSSTRRDDLLLTATELEANYLMRKALNGVKSEDAVERIVQLFVNTKSNQEFVEMIKKTKL